MKSTFVSNPMFNQIWLCWLVSLLRVIHIFPVYSFSWPTFTKNHGILRVAVLACSILLVLILQAKICDYFLAVIFVFSCASFCMCCINLYSQFLLVSLFPVLPVPSQPLPPSHGVTSCRVCTKCSAVAKPLICVFDQIAPSPCPSESSSLISWTNQAASHCVQRIS